MLNFSERIILLEVAYFARIVGAAGASLFVALVPADFIIIVDTTALVQMAFPWRVQFKMIAESTNWWHDDKKTESNKTDAYYKYLP